MSIVLPSFHIFLLVFILSWQKATGGPSSRFTRSTKTPRFISRSENFTVQIGEETVLPCEVNNLQDFVILWRKGDTILSAGNLLVRKNGRLKLLPGNSAINLQLTNAQTADAGLYFCEIDVFGKTLILKHKLDVLVPPDITSWERLVTVDAGDTLDLVCTANGNPKPKVYWQRYSKELEAAPGSGPGKSVITNVAREDGGIYVCVAENELGEKTERSTKVIVHHPPEIKIEETWRKTEQGIKVELVCSVVSNPLPTIVWYRNPTTRLATTDEILIVNKTGRSILHIENMKESFFGNYSCRAKNILGATRQDFSLSGRPQPPRLTSNPINILSNAQDYNISWTTDSFAPITEYFLYYRKSQQTEYLEVNIPVDSPLVQFTSKASYTLKNLENKAVYDVIVQAKNKHGLSDYSKIFNFYNKNNDYSSRPLAVAESGNFGTNHEGAVAEIPDPSSAAAATSTIYNFPLLSLVFALVNLDTR